MEKVFNSPSLLTILYERALFENSDKAIYNEYFTFYFTIEDFRRLILIEKLLKPHTGKYDTIRYGLLENTKADKPLSGCTVFIHDELDWGDSYHLKTNTDNFEYAGAQYVINNKGLYKS